MPPPNPVSPPPAPGLSGPPPKQGKKGLSTGAIIAIVAGAVAVLMCFGCVGGFVLLANNGESNNSKPVVSASGTATPGPRDQVVVYEVTGDGPAAISYAGAQVGGVASETNQRLPWRKEVTMGAGFHVATLTASRENDGAGALTCRITVNGKKVQEITSSGPFTNVVCSHDFTV